MGHDPRRAGPPPSSDEPMQALPPATTRRSDERCPATTRYTEPHTVLAVGVQCRFTRGHEGDHAGHASMFVGDIFWPQESR